MIKLRDALLVGASDPVIAPGRQYIIDDISAIFNGRGTFAESLIEYAGRVCYRSTARMGTAPDFVHARIREGHTDILEHAWLSMVAGIDFPFDLVEFYKKCRYLFADELGEGQYLISGGSRAWLEYFRHDSSVMAECALVAPSIFDEKIEPDALADDRIQPIEPRQHGQSKVAMLAAHNPARFYAVRNAAEHCAATFMIEGVSRTLTHQLVRHRLGSFCLSGDTVVPAFRGRYGGKQWTMQQLWQWQDDPKRKGRIRLIRLRGMNEKGELIPVKIKQVIDCGFQPVYRVTTESGRAIKATMNHLFSTPNGWRKLSDVAVGDHVWANGVPAYKNEEYLHQRYLVENTERKALAAEIGVADATLGKWIARFGLQKPKSRYCNRRPGRGKKGMFSDEVKAEISARMTGENNHWWKGDAVGADGGRTRARKMYKADVCERCDSTHRLQRHHRDGNPTNNAQGNVIVLCEPCHKAEHFGQVVMTAFRDKVTSIEFVGSEHTYDLEIDHECHNFVANGFVVHNSQESQRYVDLEKGGWSAIVPPSIAENPDALAVLDGFWGDAEVAYAKLRDLGIRKEDARFILPNAAETRLVVTMSLSGWQHFISLRDDKSAQWEIRHVAQMVKEMLAEAGF